MAQDGTLFLYYNTKLLLLLLLNVHFAQHFTKNNSNNNNIILPFLQHNTCPLCREELPTLDLEYELRKYEKKKEQEEEDDRREAYDSMYI